MHKLSVISTSLVAMLALSLATPGFGATGGPQFPIYLIPGVMDSGDAPGVGFATVIMCTNGNTVPERIRIVVRDDSSATPVGDVTGDIATTSTRTSVTHAPNATAFNVDAAISTGIIINQGMAVIFATSSLVFCTAMVVNASTTYPLGVSLHMVRFSPQPGTTE